MLSVIRRMSALTTKVEVPSRRRRFAFLLESKWRFPWRLRFTLPVAVILNRFDTALRVLLTTLFGIGIRLPLKKGRAEYEEVTLEARDF